MKTLVYGEKTSSKDYQGPYEKTGVWRKNQFKRLTACRLFSAAE
jgi:hypothetical protein